MEEDQRRRNQDEKLPANLSATGKKKKKLTHKAKKQMDNWREKNPSLFHLKFQADFVLNRRLGAVKKEMVHM